MVDMVAADPEAGRLVNHLGCRNRDVACNAADPRDPDSAENRCRCASGTPCTAVDTCGCRIPPRVWVGERDANTVPFDIASGRFEGSSGGDLVVAAASGLVFSRQQGASFGPGPVPLVNPRITRVAAASLDPEADAFRGGPSRDDVAWTAPEACVRGVGFQTACPIVRELEDPGGCFGVYASDGVTSLAGGDAQCWRYDLPLPARDVCTGDFDGNGANDAAVATSGNSVLLFLGDGWGGSSFPPVEVPLPADAVGGPMACADIDGDGMTDIVAADPAGNVSILRSGP
jgi:hypothetical protein